MALHVAVIGAGATGAASAYFLSRAGHHVTVFERFSIDHDRGSSFGESRIIRRTYADSLYTRLMSDAFPLWEALQKEVDEPIMRRTGGIVFGSKTQVMRDIEAALTTNRVPYETLTPSEVRKRFPAFRLNRKQYAIYQADSGLLRASACVRALIDLACARGAQVRENVHVLGLDKASTGRLSVRLDDGEKAAFDRILVAAGPWMSEILPDCGLPLTVTRQYYAHVAAKPRLDHFHPDNFPVWIDFDTLFYGFPIHDSAPGMKIASHARGDRVQPDAVPREPTVRDRDSVLGYTRRAFSGLTESVCGERVCLYTNTPDEDFVVDAIPNLPGAYFCSGCSGHGFKFTILLGRVLADLALDRTISPMYQRFRAGRFAESEIGA